MTGSRRWSSGSSSRVWRIRQLWSGLRGRPPAQDAPPAQVARPAQSVVVSVPPPLAPPLSARRPAALGPAFVLRAVRTRVLAHSPSAAPSVARSTAARRAPDVGLAVIDPPMGWATGALGQTYSEKSARHPRKGGAHSGPMPCSTSRRSAIDHFPSAAGLPLPRHTKQRPTAPAGEATTLCTGRRSNDPLHREVKRRPPCPRTWKRDLLPRDAVQRPSAPAYEATTRLIPHAKDAAPDRPCEAEPRAAPCEAKGLCLGMARADAHLGRGSRCLAAPWGEKCTAPRCGARHRGRKGVLGPCPGNPAEAPSRADPRRLPRRVTALGLPTGAWQVTPEIPPGRPMARRPAFDAQLAVSSTLRAGGPRSVGHRVPCGQSVAASPGRPCRRVTRGPSVARVVRVACGPSVAASQAVSRSQRGRGPAHAPGPRRPVRASPS